MTTLLMILMLLTALFLILLVMVQRGKGGGLAGALGGMGGQSAFGTKAADMFSKVTTGTAIFWIVLCTVGVMFLSSRAEGPLDEGLGGGANPVTSVAPSADDESDGAGAGNPAPEGE